MECCRLFSSVVHSGEGGCFEYISGLSLNFGLDVLLLGWFANWEFRWLARATFAECFGECVRVASERPSLLPRPLFHFPLYPCVPVSI
ncbi:hypothetical protein K503DRAFT_331115 [Rhizopogon vinicolor AM-OR11-026]|uniref:Uncharacterized protein n=1 Tax=Rhizopogon vinicolor AM-OR11-026 TaxID=1314800 RepID=A0A1B7MTU8_9AGAM|nr:hypothetical protein K503DRAFT_331115 [Rhizopogon vinicolor AM-OR11-026]